MLRIWTVFVLLAALTLGAVGYGSAVTPPPAAADFSGQARVIDGDSLSINGASLRLHGIDAPEGAQPCPGVPQGGARCGDWIARQVRAMVQGRTVSCTQRDLDGYGRPVVQCDVEGQDLNQAIVLAGLAFAYRKYAPDYIDAEEVARAAGRGIWQGSVTPPWDWRVERRARASESVALRPAPTDSCAIKGNINRKNERIFHVPGQRDYVKTGVNTAAGERWFCSEADALAAGWRKAKR